MLSLFPNLLSYPLLAFALVRLTVVLSFGHMALIRYRSKKLLSILEFVALAFLLIGLYTQAAVIVIAILALVEAYFYKMSTGTIYSNENTILSMIIILCIALLLTGPGAFAFDLPL